MLAGEGLGALIRPGVSGDIVIRVKVSDSACWPDTIHDGLDAEACNDGIIEDGNDYIILLKFKKSPVRLKCEQAGDGAERSV